MTPQGLCDALDGLKMTTRDAARELGIHETTLQMLCNGRRYPSHGGGEITKIPRYVEMALSELIRSRA